MPPGHRGVLEGDSLGGLGCLQGTGGVLEGDSLGG